MLTVIDDEGQVIVGVALSELFLAFGSYFRAITWNTPLTFIDADIS